MYVESTVCTYKCVHVLSDCSNINKYITYKTSEVLMYMEVNLGALSDIFKESTRSVADTEFLQLYVSGRMGEKELNEQSLYSLINVS